MKIRGKLVNVFHKDRVIKVQGRDRMYFLYMSRKLFKEFGLYFYSKPIVYVEASDDKKRCGEYFCNEIIAFDKIIGFERKRKVFFDIDNIKSGIRDVIFSSENKLFLDLEFSLPSFYQSKKHIPEIIQYGLVLEDADGNLILEDSSLLMPLRKYALNSRTYNFLKKTKEDFEEATTYLDFYDLLKEIIAKYDPKIIAWGTNDILTLEQSFKLNKLLPLTIRNRYINLMQLLKTYYSHRVDLGLFNTYSQMSGFEKEGQSHDALEDALLTREIYRMFKVRIIEEEN